MSNIKSNTDIHVNLEKARTTTVDLVSSMIERRNKLKDIKDSLPKGLNYADIKLYEKEINRLDKKIPTVLNKFYDITTEYKDYQEKNKYYQNISEKVAEIGTMNKEDFKLYTYSFSDNPQINKDTTFNNPQSNIDGGSNTNSIQKPVEIVNTNLEDKKFSNQSDRVVKYKIRSNKKRKHGSYRDNPLMGVFIDLNKVEEVIPEDNSNSNVKRKKRKIINEIQEKTTSTIEEIFRKSN